MIQVELASTDAGEVVIPWTTEALTATAPSDFVGGSGELNLSTATPQTSIAVAVVNDDVQESAETFRIILSNPVSSDFSVVNLPVPHIVTINDDDGGGGGVTFPIGVTSCGSSPEGLWLLRRAWGPAAEPLALLLIATGGGLERWNLLTNPPSAYSIPHLLPFVTAALYGAVGFGGGTSFVPLPDAIFAFGPTGGFYQQYFTETADFGMTVLVFGYTSDATTIGGGQLSSGYTYVQGSNVYLNTYNSVSDLYDETSTLSLSGGSAASAYAHQTTGPVAVAVSGSPGELRLLDLAGAPTVVGPLGNDPRRVRFLEPIGVVSNYGSDDLTVFTWDGTSSGPARGGFAAAPAIVGNVPVGDGPVGVDLIEVGGNVAVVSCGYNDNTYTLTVLGPDGSVVSNTTQAVPAGILNPGHAIFAEDDTSIKIIITGNGSANFAIVESGL